MTDETIVAVFDSSAAADSAMRDLQAAGVPMTAITRNSPSRAGSAGTPVTPRETGFWASVFGGEPTHDTAVYDRSLESGSEVLTVKTPEQQVSTVISVLERHHPVDIDERAAGYGLTSAGTTAGTSATARATPGVAATGTVAPLTGKDETLQLSEEQLQVGKRLVDRGTTRIRRFVVETPVEEAVTLHSERVQIERRPVTGGAQGTTDFAEKTIEVTETDEVPVVSKTARVKEEVVIRKEESDRVETVRDTVRREDVEVVNDATVGEDQAGNRPFPPHLISVAFNGRSTLSAPDAAPAITQPA